MPFTVTVRNGWLDGLGITQVQLHTGDPGASGTGGTPLGTKQNATWAAASNGTKSLASDVPFTGLGVSVAVGFFSAWAGATFVGSGPVTGDANANAAGAYTLTTGTTLTVT